jgi:hypothetical protein
VINVLAQGRRADNRDVASEVCQWPPEALHVQACAWFKSVCTATGHIYHFMSNQFFAEMPFLLASDTYHERTFLPTTCCLFWDNPWDRRSVPCNGTRLYLYLPRFSLLFHNTLSASESPGRHIACPSALLSAPNDVFYCSRRLAAIPSCPGPGFHDI